MQFIILKKNCDIVAKTTRYTSSHARNEACSWMLMRKCLLAMLILMLVILMLILMLLNLNTGYTDTDADLCIRSMSLCCIHCDVAWYIVAKNDRGISLIFAITVVGCKIRTSSFGTYSHNIGKYIAGIAITIEDATSYIWRFCMDLGTCTCTLKRCTLKLFILQILNQTK